MNLSSMKEGFGLWTQIRAVLADWKDRNFTALGTAIGMLIVGGVHFARSLGYALPFDVDQDTATRIGLGIAALCSVVHVGAPSARLNGSARVDAAAMAGPAGDGAAIGVAQPAAPVGSVTADAAAPGAVRPGRPEASGPTGDFMP